MKKFYRFLLLSMIIMFSGSAYSLSILLVNDNGYAPERVEVIKTAITNSGYDFTFFDASVEASSPGLALLNGFDLVIWYTGNDGAGLYFWDGTEVDNEAIKQYIDAGGMMWVQGLDFLYDRYPTTPVVFAAGDFVYDYLGISEYHAQSHVDDGFYSDGVPELDLISGNPIFTLNPMKWTYETMWYADACLKTPTAQNLYRMGPSGYDFYDYYSAIYLEKGDGKVVSFTFESARLDTQVNTDVLFQEGLDYFAQFGGGDQVYVSSISVYGENNATTITDNEGSLQMFADVLPENATNKALLWTVSHGTAYASITVDGLLEATGSSIGNGTVWVVAEAADGSGIADSVEVTISNQGAGPGAFEILLVNDNANGTDRYLVIDTTLANLGYTYDVYNTVTTGNRPDFITLSTYKLVIWYTGNDGADLNLWDLSDTLDYKFYGDLKNYIDGGGNVWLQGLDFMYDIEGSGPTEYASGQFIYDYMGVSKYVGQSYVDDGNVGVSQLDVVANNGVATFTPINWLYETLWYADAFEKTSSAKGIYKMGPSSYVLSGYICGLLNKPNDGRVMTWGFETARIDTRAHTEEIFDEVLHYFETLIGIDEVNQNTNVVNVFPNPATDKVKLEYTLEKRASSVQIKLFDITGKTMVDAHLGKQQPGTHDYSIIKGNNHLRSGIYFYQLSVDGVISAGKIIFN